MKLFLVDHTLIEENETIAALALASNTLLAQDWLLPRGMIDHVRHHHGVRPSDLRWWLISTYFRTVAEIRDEQPLFAPNHDRGAQAYLGLFSGLGVRMWAQEFDLTTFRDEVVEAICCRDAVLAEERLRSSIGVLSTSFDYEDLDAARSTLHLSQALWRAAAQ